MKGKYNCARTGRGIGKDRERGRRGAFFKGIINSLNALVLYIIHATDGKMENHTTPNSSLCAECVNR